MKQKIIRFSKRYELALQTRLRPGAPPDSQPAMRLGRRALTLGLTPLEVTRVHRLACARLKLAPNKKGPARQAGLFLASILAALTPPARTRKPRPIALAPGSRPLRRRTAKLAATRRRLLRGIVRRKQVATALKKSGRHYAKLLEAALLRQTDSQQLTHRVLALQEADRGNISRELQNEVAQTLLGINVRLFSLQAEARSHTKGLKNEIASAQRLVVKSAQSVRRIARKIDHP